MVRHLTAVGAVAAGRPGGGLAVTQARSGEVGPAADVKPSLAEASVAEPTVAEPRASNRGTVTRERIVAVAVELFAERGFAGTSVRDISDALGVTKAALYYYFTSKDEILDAIVNPAIDRLEAFARMAATGPDVSPREVLTDLVDVLASTAATFSPFATDPSVLHHSARGRGLKASFEGIVQRLAATVPGPFAELRVRCAVGAVQSGVIAIVLPPKIWACAVATKEHPRVIPATLSSVEIVEAGMRALGTLPTT
jgi:AcrR family transcriptional regulator